MGGDTEELVIDAVAAGRGALDKRFVELAKLATGLVGPCVPVRVRVDPGAEANPGAVLLAEDRVVITWSEGTLRPRAHTRVIALSSVTRVRRFERKVGRVSAPLDTIAFEAAGQHYELVLDSQITHPRLGFVLEGQLNGSITAEWTPTAGD